VTTSEFTIYHLEDCTFAEVWDFTDIDAGDEADRGGHRAPTEELAARVS